MIRLTTLPTAADGRITAHAHVPETPDPDGRLVVSFASIGKDRHSIQPPEFVASATGKGARHALFIGDRSRSWFNGPGIAEAIAGIVQAFRVEHALRWLATLGTSMGGFMALMLPRLMPVDTVVAFAPQYSLHPDLVPGETRWRFFRKQLTDWPYPAVDRLEAGPRYFVFHGADAAERRHWERFPDAPGLQHFIAPGHGHNLVRSLKESGKLGKVVSACLNGRDRRVRRIMGRYGAALRADVPGVHADA